MVLVVKNLPANAGDVKDTGSIPGSERFPGEGHGNPLQYSCLENSMGSIALGGHTASDVTEQLALSLCPIKGSMHVRSAAQSV